MQFHSYLWLNFKHESKGDERVRKGQEKKRGEPYQITPTYSPPFLEPPAAS